VVGLAPRAPGKIVHTRRHLGRFETAWRASFDLSAASRLVRPLNFTVTRHWARRARLEVNVISRQWRGLAHPDQAKSYVKHLRTKTLPALRKLPGFVSASILSRRLGNGIEFLIITEWESLDAIARFAGADLEAAVVPAEAAAMMIEYDQRVRHFVVIE
jgi:heme-degrading monooxygenase HmoA